MENVHPLRREQRRHRPLLQKGKIYTIISLYDDILPMEVLELSERNYYGSLCAEMYDILHQTAPGDELAFYLSYAEKGQKILEPLCGNGRFLVPFLERGFDITGLDLSGEMLAKLKQKSPHAQVFQADIAEYPGQGAYDYIFIPSCSMSLFTDISQCKQVLRKLNALLAKGGKLVFSVDTIANRCGDDSEYQTTASVKTQEGFDLILKSKNYYDEPSQTQFSPGIYELCRDGVLLDQERMDFQTHLYRAGEMEQYLRESGFSAVLAYSSYGKAPVPGSGHEILLYECSL